MQLPTWDELNAEPEQLEVLERPLNRSLFVAGPPGSGKTVLAIRRAQLAAESSEDDTAAPSVVIVTFNRMLRRLLALMDESRLAVATMQSFIWKDYERRTGNYPPRHSDDPYEYDWNAMLTTLDGHARARAMPDRQHLVVDEAQDLPEGFFRYASRHVSRTMTVFADEDQALKDRRSTLAQIKAAAGLADPVMLDPQSPQYPRNRRTGEPLPPGPSARRRRRSVFFPRAAASVPFAGSRLLRHPDSELVHESGRQHRRHR